MAKNGVSISMKSESNTMAANMSKAEMAYQLAAVMAAAGLALAYQLAYHQA
jgi:hypothetical protein